MSDARPETMMEQEANALAEMLTIKGKRRALVVVICVEGDEVTLCRGASEGTTKRDAVGFMTGLGREYERIRSKSGVAR